MIIAKTPVRVSFFGGGTDVEDWFCKYGGAVLSTTINKYCYVGYKNVLISDDYNYRAVYSRVEQVKRLDELSHPLIREIIRHFDIPRAEIVYDADLPASSGLGTSSSFAVGLISAINASKKEKWERVDIANLAIHIEREVLNEAGGLQDQIAAAYGGLNYISFNNSKNKYSVESLSMNLPMIYRLFDTMVLCRVGAARYSFETSFANNFNIDKHKDPLEFLFELATTGKDLLLNNEIAEFGKLLNIAWQHKKSLGGVTNNVIDECYDYGLSNGAWGGKLLGAGKSGFILFMMPHDIKNQFIKKMNEQKIVCIEPKFSDSGVKIINRE